MLKDFPAGVFLSTTDAARARAFFHGVLGLEVASDDEFAVAFQLANAQLRVSKVETLTPQPFTVLGWNVDDVQAAAAALTRAGVTFERYPGMEQDDLGIWMPPGGAHGVAWFKDPDGNLLSISGPLR